MQQLNNMLDKVLSIQHPERINDALRERSDRNPAQVFTVGKTGKENLISLLAKNDRGDSSVSDMGNATSVTNAFYGLSDVPDEDTLLPMIPATIDQTQTLISGATVKLRLGSDVYIHGLSIPRGHLLYGKAVLQGERLGVKISHIAAAGHILPVSLTVFDIDGQPGIYIPGAITLSTLKQSSGEGIQSMNVGSFSPSVGAQAASAGIQAAKTLLGKKIRLVKVTVKAGYKVWLVDENRKD
jgi:conjugative transposon TraM protein